MKITEHSTKKTINYIVWYSIFKKIFIIFFIGSVFVLWYLFSLSKNLPSIDELNKYNPEQVISVSTEEITPAPSTSPEYIASDTSQHSEASAEYIPPSPEEQEDNEPSILTTIVEEKKEVPTESSDVKKIN